MDLKGKTVLLTGATGASGGRSPGRWQAGGPRSSSARARAPSSTSSPSPCPAAITAPWSATWPRRARRCDCSRRRARSTSSSPTRVAGVGQAGRLHSGSARPRPAGQPGGAGADDRELLPRFVERDSGHFVYVSSISGKAATAPRVALRGDQVRPARLRLSACARPAAHEGRRLRDQPGRDRRRGDVRRLQGRRAAAHGNRQARAGRRRGGARDRARSRRDHSWLPCASECCRASRSTPGAVGKAGRADGDAVADEIASGQTEKR